MLTRKTVAIGALSKRLNAQLKASQAQESEHSDDSFKSAKNRFVLVGSVRNVEMPELRRRGGKNKNEKEKESEGANCDVRGTWIEVVDSSPTSEMVRPAICGTEDEIVGESGKKTGGSGSGKTAEGLVNLSSHVDEPGSSIEETLADLLKKVGARYNPKKRRTPTPKVPNTTKNTKKRKANSPTTAEIPLPKGRATRSMVKQSESELQKSLAESKKKRMDKGKTKVVEPSEAVDVEEMEQVHQEEHTTVEVQTPKPKKTKTSSKKSSSGSKAVEPSLAKRTRSAVKKQTS
ncbi:uncharacterized protein [Nicotiana sylvestris]|uniref:uncharacterized protein n=1 Tax=Nicotiana sylvestris TaxID=4096 RepID=UPI00388C5AB8